MMNLFLHLWTLYKNSSHVSRSLASFTQRQKDRTIQNIPAKYMMKNKMLLNKLMFNICIYVNKANYALELPVTIQ